MRVEKIMTRRAVTVEMDDSLSVVKEIFDHAPFHHLLVVDNKKLTGVLSDRDLLKALSPNLGTAAETTKDLATLKRKAHQIMTRKPVTLTADADVYQAIDLFNEQKISCIPITNEGGEPIGIVSWRDILRAIAASRKSK